MKHLDKMAEWMLACLPPVFGFLAPWWCFIALTSDEVTEWQGIIAGFAYLGVWVLCCIGGGYLGRAFALEAQQTRLRHQGAELVAWERGLKAREAALSERERAANVTAPL